MKSGKNKLLLICSIVIVSVAIAEGALRLVEEYAYTSSYHPSGDVVDLRFLNYNDSSVPKAKPKDELRILSFGDSFCHATVNESASYNGVIQKRLQAAGRTVRVVNFGEPISSVPQYLAAMKNWLPQVEHDAVMVNIFAANDLGEILREEVRDDDRLNNTMGGHFLDSHTGRKRMWHPPHLFPLRLLDFAHAAYFYYRQGPSIASCVPQPYTLALGPMDPETFARVSERNLGICRGAARESLRPALERVAELARYLSGLQAGGTRVLIVLSPAEVQINPRLFADTAKRLHADPALFDLDMPNRLVAQTIRTVDPSLEIVDLTPPIQAAMTGGRNPYYPLDAHWDAEGNRIVGEFLSSWIAAHW